MKHRNNIVVFSFIVFSLLYFRTSAQNQEEMADFILKGTVLYEKKPLKDVLLEVTKNNKEIVKLTSSSNGKFSIKIFQNTTDTNSNYILTISKAGFVTKTLDINTYIPLSDYDGDPFVYTVEVELIATNISNVAIKRPFGKIKWNHEEQLYAIDEIYYRTIFKEEQLLKNNPDKYLLEMITKEKEERKIMIGDDKAQMAIREGKRDSIAALEKKDSSLLVKQAVTEKINVPIPDTVKEVKKDILVKQVLPIKKIGITIPVKHQLTVKGPVNQTLIDTKPITEEGAVVNSDQDLFDVAILTSIKQQKKQMENLKMKMADKKAENLATKYETSNILTSLMDVVDAYDKNNTK